MRAGYKITDVLSQSWKYTLRQDEITGVSSDASAAIKEQEGEFVTSSVGQSMLYDKRDSRFAPTDGYFIEVGNTIAGFGGDSKYFRSEIKSGTFFTLADRWILNIGGGGGYIVGIGEDIRIIDGFFLGGNSLRGFDDAGVGPRDRATQDAVGGNWFYRGTVGVSFPLRAAK